MKLIVPGVHFVTGLMGGRVYVIEDPDGLTIIDTSIKGAAPKIVAQVEAMGRTKEDIKRILITHAHPDHVGGLPELKQLTGAQVIVPEGEKAVTEGREPARRPPKEAVKGIGRIMSGPDTMLPGTPVDRTLTDEETLPEVMGGLVAIGTPGHSPDHMSFWHPQRRILFAGDVLFHLLGITLPFAAMTLNMGENIKSVGRVALLEPDIVCFGHGEPLVDQAAGKVKAFAMKIGAL